ncbi:hypothetical protein HNR46_002213 [Haloferula luteola]|uniref:Uncharacterized protein n=1 Tax=Haloferula luteola TaxID=595692 RepID=A0A840V8Q8_9BACT|nr:thrombospondin type 3 repeat-containing protein [Haloferula luteola]MBB5351974.1 hypothetical protein [Haloferula luteola]
MKYWNHLPPMIARCRHGFWRSLCLSVAVFFGLALPASAEWGGVGGWTPFPSDFLPSPSSNDTDGDGIPNAWELAHDLNPDVARDAWSDFDRDGVTALQEYQIHTLTGGLYGNPTGTWSSQVLPAVPWASSASYQIVECASNGILLVHRQRINRHTICFSEACPKRYRP